MSRISIRRRLLAVTVMAATAITALSGCSLINDAARDQATRPTISLPSADPAPETSTPAEQGVSTDQVDEQHDYVTVLGPAQREHQAATNGKIEYCDLDAQERPTCAYGELTADLRTVVQNKNERQDITFDPAGWPAHNAEVEIPALDSVTGSKTYHGWMFNRSHLIADSLGGDAVPENMVTGTRTQNVGSHQEHGQYAGGMAYTELMARDYLDDANANVCPLYYAATPVYEQDTDLVPRSVIVDIQSCDKTIDQRVRVDNTAKGWIIDYATGEYAPVGR